ncbi:hypothetical protein EAH76_05110 [Sphingomonas glacialis]|uniref:Glycosyltransferase RgtA/B/C/D-like domain-containing protein n=2 Tax=Sphingomonas glacialis TaxID=658225 RepID=A0A502FXV2_9SPHN|nr:hypothetical protein EAH76_05110 [Sphingomonas glacialis]
MSPIPPSSQAQRGGRVPTFAQVALIAAIALLARIMTFGDPVIQVDEEFYYVTAQAMWRGALPYIDIWDRKPIGLFLLYMPAAGLPLRWGLLAYQAMATLSLILTALLVAHLARRAGWGRGALAGAIAYVVWPDLLNGVGGQSPIFYNLPMVAAAALIVAAGERRDRRVLGGLAMVLVGTAMQIKYTALFEGIFFGLWLLRQEWRAVRRPVMLAAYGAILVALALAPTVAAYGFYAAHGQADAFVFANFASIAHRNANPLGEMARNIATLVLILSPLVAMAFAARGGTRDGSPDARGFLYLWFAAAVIGLVLFGTWFDHYGLPVLVPGCACAAGFFGNARFRRRLGPAILVIVALAAQIVVQVNLRARGDAAQFAALSEAVGRGPGCLYVYSGTTMLYAATERCRLSRYVVPAHLNRARESGATGVDQASEVRRILAARPAVVVMRPAFSGERPEIRQIVTAAMARDYRLVAVRPMGHEAIAVYRRR